MDLGCSMMTVFVSLTLELAEGDGNGLGVAGRRGSGLWLFIWLGSLITYTPLL